MPCSSCRLALLTAVIFLITGACRLSRTPIAPHIDHLTSSPNATPVIAPPVAGAPFPVSTRLSPGPTATPVATASASRGDTRLTPPPYVTPAPVLRPTQGREDPILAKVIEEALGADAASASVVVKRLTDGTVARWNPDRIYYAASLYKLEVLYEAFRQQRLGVLNFERTVPIIDRYAAEDLGTLSRLPRAATGEVAIADAVRAMIMLSDNTSATLLLDLLGHRNIDATMAALGLTSSSVNTIELPTTAADMARLMEAIVRGEGLDAEAARAMVELLLAQETRAGIPRGVPAGVLVGNKTGTWPGATHDVAVVLAPSGTYVLAVLTEGSWAWAPIVRVSRAVYEYWAANGPSRGGR